VHRKIAYFIALIVLSGFAQRVSSYPIAESECTIRMKYLNREGKFILLSTVADKPPENNARDRPPPCKKSVSASTPDATTSSKQLHQPIGTVDSQNGRHIFKPVEWVLDHQRVGHYSEGLCHVTLEISPDRHRQEAFINLSHEIVLTLPTSVKACGDFHDELAAVVMDHADDKFHQMGECVGFVNLTGTLVIPAIYELPRRWRHYNPVEMIAFHDSRVHVRKLGIDYYLDKTGKPIASFQGARCNDFCDGVATVGVLVDGQGNDIDFSDESHGYQNRFDYESDLCKILSAKLRDVKIERQIMIRFYENEDTSPDVSAKHTMPAETLAKVRAIVNATQMPKRGIFMDTRRYFDVYLQNGAVMCEPFFSQF
jgi:hypothetical protein